MRGATDVPSSFSQNLRAVDRCTDEQCRKRLCLVSITYPRCMSVNRRTWYSASVRCVRFLL